MIVIKVQEMHWYEKVGLTVSAYELNYGLQRLNADERVSGKLNGS